MLTAKICLLCALAVLVAYAVSNDPFDGGCF